MTSKAVATYCSHCNTCGQSNTACAAIGPKIEDTGGTTHCSLREIEVNGRANLDIIKLDKLKLAQLPTKQFEQVIAMSTKQGCLSNLTKEAIEAYMYQFKHHRDAIKESFGVTRASS